MIWQAFHWLLLGAWALAAVVTAIQFAFDALAADARGARLPARSLLSAVRLFIRCGVIFSTVVVFAAIFDTVDRIWDFSFKPLSYDLTAYSGFVKKALLGAVLWIGFIMVVRLLDRLLDRFLPNGPADRTPTAQNSSDERVANGS